MSNCCEYTVTLCILRGLLENRSVEIQSSPSLTHEEMYGVFLILFHNASHKELAPKQPWRHEGAVFGHANLIRAELHPV